MTAERERGWQAFQEGRIDEAIELLSQACLENPGDYQAHCYLGAVYGKAERHEESIATLTAAVHLQPANAQARFNLGVAMEKAGFAPQAIEAYRQAMTLDPGYSNARTALERLGDLPPEAANSQSDLTAHDSSRRTVGAWTRAASDPSSEADIVPPGRATTASLPQQAEAVPGFAAAEATRTAALPSYGLLSSYAASPHAPAGPSAVLEPYAPELPPPNFNDEIDIPQTIRDFGRILVTPDRFFRGQAGRNGLMSPIVMVETLSCSCSFTTLITSSAQSLPGFIVSLALSPVSLAVAGAQMLVVYLLSALLVHFIGWILGNRQDYSVSVRACVYADAPRFLLTLILSCYLAFFFFPSYNAHPITSVEIEKILGVPAGSMTGATTSFTTRGPIVTARGKQSSPPPLPASAPSPQFGPDTAVRAIGFFWNRFGTMMLVSLGFTVVGWLWSSVLLALAIHRLQRIPPLAAAGVVIIMYGLGIVLLLLLLFALKGAILALLHWFITMGPAAGVGAASSGTLSETDKIYAMKSSQTGGIDRRALASPRALLTSEEILARWMSERDRAPLDRLVQAELRRRRYLNSSERRWIADALFGTVRYLRRQNRLLTGSDEGGSPRDLIALWVRQSAENAGAHDAIDGRLPASDRLAETLRYTLSFPDEMAAELEELLGADATEAAEALNRQAPTTLRVNTLRASQKAVRDQLTGSTEGRYSPWAITLAARPNITELPGFLQGWLELQEEASQLIALLTDALPGQTVVEIGAGAGGKTLAIAAMMRNEGRIFAVDTSTDRLDQLRKRAIRSGVRCIRLLHAAADEAGRSQLSGLSARSVDRLTGTTDVVLVDAPCSGSGVLRRSPDLKWLHGNQAAFAQRQLQMLEQAAGFVGPGGFLIYATCAFERAQDEEVIESFLGSEDGSCFETAPAIPRLERAVERFETSQADRGDQPARF